jgi:CRP/FNR family transcriptional regulator, cyclic AMP receptor protein
MAALEETLAGVPLLKSLDRRTLSSLAAAGKLRRYAAGETIVRENDPGIALYILVSGRARVARGAGNPQELGELRPGDFFGELAIIEEHARTATVTAVEDTECLLLKGWEFRSLLKEHPSVAIPIMDALIARLHRAEHRPA